MHGEIVNTKRCFDNISVSYDCSAYIERNYYSSILKLVRCVIYIQSNTLLLSTKNNLKYNVPIERKIIISYVTHNFFLVV